MKRTILGVIFVFFIWISSYSQPVPTGNPADFKVKTCLHSIGYAGMWRVQEKLTVDDFLLKAKELGFDGVMLMAKRPHGTGIIIKATWSIMKLRHRLCLLYQWVKG